MVSGFGICRGFDWMALVSWIEVEIPMGMAGRWVERRWVEKGEGAWV